MTITWNQKNLDYEIETNACNIQVGFTEVTWNQKNLDYEIETLFSSLWHAPWTSLEIKRTSITRLKLW